MFEQYRPEVKRARKEEDKVVEEASQSKGAPVLKKPASLKHYSLEQFVDQIVMAFADANKGTYKDLDQEVSDHLHQIFKLQMGISELQRQLFDLLDSRLGTFKTPFQARNYKKVILSVQKSRILNEAEINVLFVKANRFLSKDSIKKEKGLIAKEVKAGFITGSGSKDGRVYLRDGVLVESSEEDKNSDDGIDYSKVKKAAKMDDGSDFEDISSDEEPSSNKRGGKEDPRNRMYLQHYRETVEYE